MVNMIILNGGSSSGKTSIATRLQTLLAHPWLRFSIDDLVDAMPPSFETSSNGVGLGPEGTVTPGDEFRVLESAWMQGIAAMVRAGAPIIVDDVFLSGVESRRRWEAALADVSISPLWIGIHCDAAIAAQREKTRPDRIIGMAERQAEMVHVGMAYDLEFDTTRMSPEACARRIAERILADELSRE